jgi:hypothetical protein
MAEEITEKEITNVLDPKQFWKSKTFWGLVVVLLSRFLPIEDQTGLSNDLFTLAGILFTLYGRVKAKQPLTAKRATESEEDVQPKTD